MLGGPLCAMLASLLACSSTSWGAEPAPPSYQDLQKKIVEALAAGRDVKPLIEELKGVLAGTPPTASPLPNSNQESAQLEQRLNELRVALRDAAGKASLSPQALSSLLAPYEAFQAAHLLVQDQFDAVQEKLAHAGTPADFESRRQQAQQAYEQVIAELNRLLDPVLGALLRPENKERLLNDAAFRARSLSAIRGAYQLLVAQTNRAPAPILRADTLPFRQAKLAQRSPKLSPTVQPSYLATQEQDALPLPADSAGTLDAPLTDEIVQKAKDLGYDYIRIYEFVRNEVRTEWYAGGMKGAVGALRQKSGNDIDQASLLIGLFRASGLPSRYVHGVVEMPIDDVMNSLGLSDSTQATTALTRAGVAYSPVIRGGRVAAVNVEHTWVSAYVPYTNYRGAVVDVSGKTWLPLMPALKRYDVVTSLRAFAAAGLAADAFVDSYLQDEQTVSPIDVIRKRVADYLQASNSAIPYAQQLGASTVTVKALGLLPNTVPVSVVAVTAEAAELADAYRQRLRIVVRQGSSAGGAVLLDYTIPVSSAASERLTLSYIPATVDDQRTTDLFGGLDYVPAYLVKLRAQIKINGRQKAVAEGAIDAGVPHRLEIQLLSPFGTEVVEQVVIAGGYHAIGVYAQQVARRVVDNDPADTEFDAARLLERIAWSYSDRWNQAEAELAGLLDVAVVRPRPTLAIASNALRVDTLFGRPSKLEWQGVTLDAALRQSEPIARNASAATAKDWMRLSALQGSALEHQVFEDEFLVDSISADKGLRAARASGGTVLRVTPANVASLLPTLNHPAEVKADIANWARLGMTVDVPRDPITRNAWSGSVWRVDDPTSGAGGYFIAGGFAGGATTVKGDGWLLVWLRDALIAANTAAANADPLAGATITKIFSTDGKQGEVGKALPTQIAVIVRDIKGNPVIGATVKFRVAEGGGSFGDAPSIIVPTDLLGIAQTPFVLGQKTAAFPVYVFRDSGDQFVTQAGLNLVDAAVETHRGALVIDTPFSAVGLPQVAVKLVRTNPASSGSAANTFADTIIVQTQDQYGNSVSNVNVTFAMGAMQPGDCDPPAKNPRNGVVFDAQVDDSGRIPGCPINPILGDCGSGSVSGKTPYRGRAGGVILGNLAGATYQAIVSGAGGGLTYSYSSGACKAGSFQFATSTSVIDEFGNIVHAAKPLEEFKFPIRATIFSETREVTSTPFTQERCDDKGENCSPFTLCDTKMHPDRSLTRVNGNVSFNVTNGGFATGASSAGQGTYETRVTTGPFAAADVVKIDATQIQYPNIKVDPPECNPTPETKSDGELHQGITVVYALQPAVTDLVSGGKDPQRIYLNETGQSLFPAQVNYETKPGAYHSLATDIDFFEDGKWFDYVVGSTRSGVGSGRIPRGTTFDLNKSYEAQVVVNRGSPMEVKSEKFALTISQKMFKDVEANVHVTQDVDILNARVCEKGGSFDFTLTQPATVTLTFTPKPGEFGVARTIIDGEDFDKGPHSKTIFPSDLSTGKYIFELKGVSKKDGHVETVNGSASAEYTTHSHLPVGHVLVKGVDLFDGGLATGSTDLSVPARGAALEFRRSYSSNASLVPGRLGVGWSHNYDSKVIITPCGDVIVIGAEGGGMRFVEDGSGGLKPLKGYHGSLIPNHTDRTFDFYSKDGTRYHYRNFGTRVEWNLEFIEDTNGNVTKLGYDPTSLQVAKLITVEDSAKRTLKFKYEDKAFDGSLPVPVVVGVEGPDGMAVTFEYDAIGNLISAVREKDPLDSDPTKVGARVERYEYPVDTSTPLHLQHRLTRYTNPNGAVTAYSYISMEFTVTIGSITSTPLILPTNIVQEVDEAEGGVTRFEFDANIAIPLTRRVIDARNNVTAYSLNQYGSPLTIKDPVSTTTMTWAADDVVMTSKTDGRGVRTDYTYDTNGNVLTEIVDGKTTTYTYQPFSLPPIKNRVKTKTDRNGHTTTYAYDARGNLVSELNAEGGETRHTYADNGDRLEARDPNGNSTRFTYDAYGNLETGTNALAGVTKRESNIRGLLLKITDPLGRVTTFAYDTLNRLLTKVDPLKSVHEFTYDAVGNKLTEKDEEGRLTTWTYDKENRVKTIRDPFAHTKTFTYDLVGNKTAETDWKSNTTSYDYDAANRLIARREPLAKTTSFVYDGVGNVTSETDALNRVTKYEYDALNRRTQKTDALAGITVYGYDGVGNKTSERDPLGRVVAYAYDGLNRLTQKTEPLARITKYKYDANGNHTEETDPNGGVRALAYDVLNRLSKRTDALANDTNYEYDAIGNLTQEINARLFRTSHEYDALNRRTKTTDAEKGVMTYGYDKVGNRTSETWPNANHVANVYDALNRLTSSSDDLGPRATYEYDANGNRTREVDANGNVTAKTYDALNRYTQTDMPEARTMKFGYDLIGNKTAETDANNNVTRFAYDALNRLQQTTDPFLKTIVYTYDAVGNKTKETDKRGIDTRFEYSDLNRLTKVTDPFDKFVAFTYDPVGNKKTETDKRGTLTKYDYDKENRLTITTKAGLTILTTQYDEVGNKKFDTDAKGNVIAYIYDGRNLLLTESRLLAAITNYQYDSIGNRTQMRDPENRIARTTYDARRRMLTETNDAAETTTHAYDGNGNRTSTQRPKGNKWSYVYDGANRLTSITDPATGVTAYAYDKNNNRLSQTDANKRTTSYEYDALNRQTSLKYADNTQAQFRYDENGNRIGLTDPNNQVFSYTFDALNRETDKNYPTPVPATDDDIQNIVTTYDENGNVTQVRETYTGPTGVRITAKSYDAFDRMADVTDAFGKIVKYQYDANGNRTFLTDPDGKVTRYTYDELNRVSTVSNGGGTTTYEYDRSSLPRTTTYPNGTNAVNTYDRAKRTLTVTNKQGTAIVSSYQYAYDTNGNRTQQIEQNGAAAETTNYAYDANDRLMSVAYPTKTTTYTYDAAYNRLTERTATTASVVEVDKTYSYNVRNQLTQITDGTSAANNATYNYDANGSQTIKTKNGVTTTFVYDVRDQLVSVQENATTLGAFRYDYQGMRVVKDMGGQILRYTYDDKSVLVETDNTGATIAKFDYGAHRLLSLTHATEGRQFYLFDALGSVANLTTPAGAVQARYQYDAFGNFRAQAGSSFNRFTFTGHEKDNETNLFYFKARFYDPETGRFLGQDAYLGDINTPPSLHRYLYAYANPLVYIDLMGYEAEASSNQDENKPLSPEEYNKQVEAANERIRAYNDACAANGTCYTEKEMAERRRVEEANEKEAMRSFAIVTEGEDGPRTEKTPGQEYAEKLHEKGARTMSQAGDIMCAASTFCTLTEVATGKESAASLINPVRGVQALGKGARILKTEGRLANAEGRLAARTTEDVVKETEQGATAVAKANKGAFKNVESMDTKALGNVGEEITREGLRSQGHTILAKIENPSGHGIDIVSHDANGKLVFTEVKTSRTGEAGRLSKAQEDPRSFVLDRLEKAEKGEGAWAKVSDSVRLEAQRLRREIQESSDYVTLKVDVMFDPRNVNSVPKVKVSPWGSPWGK